MSCLFLRCKSNQRLGRSPGKTRQTRCFGVPNCHLSLSLSRGGSKSFQAALRIRPSPAFSFAVSMALIARQTVWPHLSRADRVSVYGRTCLSGLTWMDRRVEVLSPIPILPKRYRKRRLILSFHHMWPKQTPTRAPAPSVFEFHNPPPLLVTGLSRTSMSLEPQAGSSSALEVEHAWAMARPGRWG